MLSEVYRLESNEYFAISIQHNSVKN